MQIIKTYLNNCNRLLQAENAREHSYRGHLETVQQNYKCTFKNR